MRRRIISKTDNTVLIPPSSNRIKYTTSDNKIINISEISEKKNIISNTYVEDFGGIIELDGILTDMYPRLFSNKITLTGITLPNTLHYIAFATFEYCQGLEEAIISNNIINIYKQAFAGCINLKKIHIGKSVERLGYEDGSESLDEYSVFLNCPNISEITVDPTNIIYSDGSDSGGANVILDKNTKTLLVGCKNSIIPTSAFIIGYHAFSECSGMVIITIPSNILEIKEWAFYECSDLKTIIFESTTPAIIPANSNHKIFNDRLEKILVPHESVDLYKESWSNYADKIFSSALFINYTTSDGNIITPAKTNAFGDAQIVSNTYSNGIGIIELDKPCTVLKDSAFADITTLTSFKIPESVTSIEKSIFLNNTGIEEIYIPKNVTTLGENVLRNMYSLKKIVVDPRNTVFDSRDNCNAIIKTSTNTLLSCCIDTVIPESVKIIGVRAYQGVQAENFTIPNWITKLESHAFGWCDKLKSITIPNSVTNIGNYAFYECPGLEKVYINDLAAWYGINFANDYANPLSYAKNLYLNSELVTELVIPDDIKEIKKYTFYNCKGLTSITIPDSVTSIGNYTFSGCSGLKEVHISDIAAWCNIDFGNSEANPLYYTENMYLNGNLVTDLIIPNSVTSIGKFAFSSCDGLTSVTIPNSVTSIGIYAFSYCSKLTSITVGNSVISISSSAFDGCTGLTSVTIPNSVTSIGDSAFRNCSGLKEVVIGNSVTSIEGQAFQGCKGLKSITIPNSVTSIGNRAFENCTELTGELIIPNSVTSIGDHTFRYCSKLTSFVIGNSVTSIGNYMFYGCSGLTSVTIPNSVTSIGEWAFDGCWGLTSITIPDSVTSIGGGALSYTTWCINQPDGVVYAGKVLYVYKGTMPSNTSITIKEGTLGIANSAFSGCSGLTSITIPNSVTNIGQMAFYNCSKLTSIVIPNGVTTIKHAAFMFCSGLASIVISNSVTSIEGQAFEYCSKLKTVYNLSNLTFSKGSTDYGYIARYADKVYNLPEGFIENGFVLGKVNDVNTLVTYLGNASEIILPADYKGENYVIGDDAFRGNKTITRITIPDSVTSIGDYAFHGCSGLTSVTIGNGVKSVEWYAFEGCSKLTSVVIGNSVTSIGVGAFNNCSGLASIEIPNSVTIIGPKAFHGCIGLTSVVIGNSVTSIEWYAFRECTSLTSITIPNSVTSIGSSAFDDCTGLTEIYCKPTTPPSISSDVFSYLPSSAKIYVPQDSVEAYKTATGWVEYADIITYKTSTPTHGDGSN